MQGRREPLHRLETAENLPPRLPPSVPHDDKSRYVRARVIARADEHNGVPVVVIRQPRALHVTDDITLPVPIDPPKLRLECHCDLTLTPRSATTVASHNAAVLRSFGLGIGAAKRSTQGSCQSEWM